MEKYSIERKNFEKKEQGNKRDKAKKHPTAPRDGL